MDFGHWVAHLKDSIAPFLTPLQLFSLLCVSREIQKTYDTPLFWKQRIQQYYPQVYPNGNIHLTNYQLFRVLTLPHRYCNICSEPLHTQEQSEQCLLQLCECLGIKDYLRSHTDCLAPYLKPKRTCCIRVRSHTCPFCGETRMCLPIRNRPNT